MIATILWVILVWWCSSQLVGWEWWFWVLTACIPPLILLPIIDAVAR